MARRSVIGGTSAVAPLWAGLVAVANQQLGTQVGFIQPAIYAAKAAAAFNDITEGNNGAFSAGRRLGRLHRARLAHCRQADSAAGAGQRERQSRRETVSQGGEKDGKEVSQVGFQPGHQPLPVSTCQCWHMGDH